jgi:protein-S-isoprenylcysteine O-methyltransferase Ste14
LKLKVPPLVQLLLVGAAMLAISRLIPLLTLSIPENIPAGGGVVLIGVVVALFGVLEFRKAKTTVDPRYPQKSENLVTSGIYNISRNPMYLGFFLILLGWCVILANVAALLLLPVFVSYINHFQIKPEEQFLLQKFGSDFSQYCNKVRRWI